MGANNGQVVAARRLFYFPILHTQIDLGSLGDGVRRAAVRRLGRQAWQRKVHLVDDLWAKIEREINALTLPYENVRLYQDGLADCGREKEIVAELAKAGSRNYQLLLRLIECGATIMGTESSELLVKEHRLMKQLVSGAGLPQRRKDYQEKLHRSLLEQRDAFIAQRINSTLRVGETGVLFLGMLHSLDGRLSPDVRVIYPSWHSSAPRKEMP